MSKFKNNIIFLIKKYSYLYRLQTSEDEGFVSANSSTSSIPKQLENSLPGLQFEDDQPYIGYRFVIYIMLFFKYFQIISNH